MATETTRRVDPVTFEVLRHRLWEINDEQAMITARISGSPAIYEAHDFNAGLLTADGKCFLVGVYVTYMATCMEIGVASIRSIFGDRIYEGDRFIYNDPWAGGMHMNDTVMISPIFWEGQLVAWAGICMHEMDVGGPVPGSFAVGADCAFGEAPIVPPVKIVERGEYRPEIEAIFIRNTRLPAMLGLNIKARIASQEMVHKRIHETIRRYGAEAFLATVEKLSDLTAQELKRRLEELPDGTWVQETYIDHDGRNDILYRLRLTMTKTGGKITFDYRGTDPQAPGLINCAKTGLIGGTVAAFFPLVCYGVPWSLAALHDIVEIISDEGTINNASYPAALSMASISANWTTCNLVNCTLGKMFCASKKYREEGQACWYGGWIGIVVAGLDQEGRPLAAVLMDTAAGGAAAKTYEDGMDTGGYLVTTAAAMPNVETNERHYPFLMLYRREYHDSSGAGKYRGGVGMEFAIMPYDNPVPLGMVLFSTGHALPVAPGVFGGLPASINVHQVFRGTNIQEMLQQRKLPSDVTKDVTSQQVETFPAKAITALTAGDVFRCVCSGGGGYGDPLERDLHAIAKDIKQGLCSVPVAENVYGVVLSSKGTVEAAKTSDRRDSIRQRRISEGRPVGTLNTGRDLEKAEDVSSIADCFKVVRAVDSGRLHIRCSKCDYEYGALDRSPRETSLMREVSIADWSPLNSLGKVDEVIGREYLCPGCGQLNGVDYQRKGDAPYFDMFLRGLGK